MTVPRAADAKVDIDLPPPVGEQWVARVRRWWRSQGRFRGLRFWLPFRGLPLLTLYGIIFVVNGIWIGWRDAYDVSVQITSPMQTRAPVPAFVLSLAGWLLVPGIAGAVAGHIVSEAIGVRRTRPVKQIFAGSDDE